MITAKIVKYYNDYNQKAFDKTFENLDELADWIFDQMQLDYTKKPGCDFLTFPTNRFGKWYEISVRPNYGGYVYWIHEIDSESGIIFSSGKYTAGKDFCAEKVQEWFQKCEERKKHPKFNFVEVQAVDIVEKFKQYMLDNGITYEEAAKRIGWTRQNLWYKLNVGVSPTYGTIKKIADGLGFEIRLTQDGKPDITKLEDIAADTEDDSARFIIIEHVINSMGYSLEIVPPEK